MSRKYSEVVNVVPNYPIVQNRHNSRQASSGQKLSPVEQVRPSFSPTIYNNTQYQTFLSPSQIPNQQMQGRNSSFQANERRSLPNFNPKIDGAQQIHSPVFDPRAQTCNGFRNNGFADLLSEPRRFSGQNLSSQPIQTNYNSPQNITKIRQFDINQFPDTMSRNLQTTHTSPAKVQIPQRSAHFNPNLNVIIPPRHQLNPNIPNINRQNGRICQSMIIQQSSNDKNFLGNNSAVSPGSNVSNGNNSLSDLESTFSSDHYSSFVDLNSPVFSQPGSKPRKPQMNPRYRKNDDVWKSAEFSLLRNNNNFSTGNLASLGTIPVKFLDTIKEREEICMKEIKKNIQSIKVQEKQKKLSLMETKAQTPTANDSPVPPQFKFRKRNDMGFSQPIDLSNITPKSKQATPRNWTIDDFQTIQKLGRGTYGQVYLVRQRKSKFVCVIKSMSKKRIKQLNLQEHVFRQIKIQSYLVHKHLTALYGVFHDQNKLYLILECMPDGSMASNGKKKISEEETAHLIYQVCDGLLYMHRQDIIHRDIKPQNLLLNNTYLKIGDFGCAVFGNTLRRTVVGCYAYISPQQFSNTPYDQKIDSWCVGTLAYELLTGKPPYEQKLKQIAIEAQKQQKITKQGMKTVEFPQITFPKDVKVSPQGLDFIKRLLDNDPATRADLKQALKHKFLQKAKQYQKYLQSKL